MIRIGLAVALVLGACGGEEVHQQATLVALDEAGEELAVSFAGGHRLIHANVPSVANPGERALFELDFEWSQDLPEAIELSLWEAGGSEPELVEKLGVDGAQPREVQRIEWSLEIPEKMGKGPHWVMTRLRSADAVLEADSFSSGWVMLGLVWVVDAGQILPPTPLPAPALSADKKTAILAVGGDLNVGRRQNGISGERGLDEAFEGLDVFRDADLGFANLESVISDVGVQGVDKGEAAPFYYRGRPEQAGLLVHAGIDVVGTANNHSGDYGPAALLRQSEILTQAGIAGVGSGEDRLEACSPTYAWAGPLRIGFLGIDTTQARFGAREGGAGACYVDLEEADAEGSEWARGIAEARTQADLVMVAVHWGKNNRSRPSRQTRQFAHVLIAHGVDAVLGSSAHRLQGVEIVKGKPVIYDAGNLLFDSHLSGEASRSAVFELTLTEEGVHRIEVTPVAVGYGRVAEATGNVASRVLRRFRLLSAELGTPTRIQGSRLWIDLPVQRRQGTVDRTGWPEPALRGQAQFQKAEEPPPGCLVDEVPESHRLEHPVPIGPYELLGVSLSPDQLDSRELVWMESYWRIKAPTEDQWIATRLVASDENPSKMWWADHELCDWMWPSSRWELGAIYRDRYSIRPPSPLPKGVYQLVLGAMKEDSDPTGFAWRGPQVVVE